MTPLPAAGDLTDSKTARGAGLQQEAEWVAYRAMVANLTGSGASGRGGSRASSGSGKGWALAEAAVLDVKGNHDTFNMASRGGAADYWPEYAAEGRRSGPQQRVFVHALSPGQQIQEVPQAARQRGAGQQQQRQGRQLRGSAGGAVEPAGVLAAAVAAVRQVLGLVAPGAAAAAGVQTAPAARGQQEVEEGQNCPAAWLLGIDASPAPGLKSPTNFVGEGGSLGAARQRECAHAPSHPGGGVLVRAAPLAAAGGTVLGDAALLARFAPTTLVPGAHLVAAGRACHSSGSPAAVEDPQSPQPWACGGQARPAVK